MKLTEGAASSWANLRSATLLMLTNRRHLPVVNRLSVSEQANDWIDMGQILSVNRLTVNSKTVDSYLDIAPGRTNEAWVALLSGLPGACRSPTAGGGRLPPPIGQRVSPSARTSLRAIEVFTRLGAVEQEIEEPFQVCLGRRRQLNDKDHRSSFLRLASSLDWSLSRTVATGIETPVRWYASDATCARVWNVVWKRRYAIALRTVASMNSVSVSPGWSTDSSSARSSGSTRIWGMTADFMTGVYCAWVTVTVGYSFVDFVWLQVLALSDNTPR
jgi:hypothetical protein